jgi:hypothetical protein
MGQSLEPWPTWAEKALQGLAFWIGHRHSLYPNYPLGESALVAETCNLIFANLGRHETLLCERQYAGELMPRRAWPAAQGPRARADLAIVKGLSYEAANGQKSLQGYVSAVIEVKRASAPKGQIDQDLKRLAILKLSNPVVRALLFVVAEAHRPKRFVAPEGKAILGKNEIPETDAHYRVRRACKAAAAFSGKESAHYACIVEVFAGAHDP